MERRPDYRDHIPAGRGIFVILLSIAGGIQTLSACAAIADYQAESTDHRVAIHFAAAVGCFFAAAVLWSLCEIVGLAKAREAREAGSQRAIEEIPLTEVPNEEEPPAVSVRKAASDFLTRR